MEEGKATLRFKQPAHDLCITKCDKILLKSFLSVLKKILTTNDCQGITFSSLNTPATVKQVNKAQTKMVVTEKKNYPITTNFPHTLEKLQVTGINLKRVDSRIFNLKCLVDLDLSDNAITNLPDEISSFNHLRELRLAGNELSHLPRSFFYGNLGNQLRFLDLSRNSLTFLPNDIANLRNLRTLKLDENKLKRLPFRVGKMLLIMRLSAANNQIETLPGTLAQTMLDELDLSGNPLKSIEDQNNAVVMNKISFRTLMDLTIITCLKHSIRPTEEDLPRSVLQYMDSYQKCQCGNICLRSKAVLLVPMAFYRIANTYSCDGKSRGLFEVTVCSNECLERYRKNPFAM